VRAGNGAADGAALFPVLSGGTGIVALLLASKLIAGGRGLAPAVLRRAASVELDWDTRQKSRFEATDSLGRRVAVFLPRGRIVRGGDVLVGEDGSLIAVKAAAQAILVVTTAAGGEPLDLLRAAYHLGNRHVPLEVRADRLQLEPDHVLAELLRRMGLQVDAANGPFEPEAGAYDTVSSAPGHADATGHGHDHDHRHADHELS
jgi:urease accessory protein